MDWICGDQITTPYKTQLLNWALAVFFLTLIYTITQQYFLGIDGYDKLIVLQIMSGIAYVFCRLNIVNHNFSLSYFIASLFLVFTYNWYITHGIYGGVSFYYVVSFLCISLLFTRKLKITLWALFFLHFIILASLQYYAPDLVAHHSSSVILLINRMLDWLMATAISLGFMSVIFNRLENERRFSNYLLNAIFPKDIIQNLENQSIENITKSHAAVSIIFIEITGFYKIAAQLGPSSTVYLLTNVFNRIDSYAKELGVEKIKTVGNIYMAAAGLNSYDHTKTINIVEFAIRLLKLSRRQLFTAENLAFRIGIHTGPVAAGVIDQKKLIYDLWGNTVNLASRLMSHGTSHTIQITKSTYDIIRDVYPFAYAGKILIKGVGLIPVWRFTCAASNADQGNQSKQHDE